MMETITALIWLAVMIGLITIGIREADKDFWNYWAKQEEK